MPFGQRRKFYSNDIQTVKQTLAEVEKSHIKDVLLHTASIEEKARVLSIDPATLGRKRKKYQLD